MQKKDRRSSWSFGEIQEVIFVEKLLIIILKCKKTKTLRLIIYYLLEKSHGKRKTIQHPHFDNLI
jgi:hypothetical protein